MNAFLAIVEYGSLTAAAEALYLTQSALSSRLDNLEKEVGVRLIHRGKGVRRIELTDAGYNMIPIAKKWKDLYAETKGIAAQAERKLMNISAVHSIQAYLMGPVYKAFLKDNPHCDLHIFSMDSERTYQMIEKGQMEAGLISEYQYSKKIVAIPLFKEPMCFVCAKDSEYEGTIVPSELMPENEVYMKWHPDFIRWHTLWFGGRERPRIETDSMKLMEYFLTEQKTWMILPVSAVQKLKETVQIKTLPMKDGPGDRIIYLLLKDKNVYGREMKDLLSLLKEHLKRFGIQWIAEESSF